MPIKTDTNISSEVTTLQLGSNISNGIKTIENISEFKTLLKKWNGSPCIYVKIVSLAP